MEESSAYVSRNRAVANSLWSDLLLCRRRPFCQCSLNNTCDLRLHIPVFITHILGWYNAGRHVDQAIKARPLLAS